MKVQRALCSHDRSEKYSSATAIRGALYNKVSVDGYIPAESLSVIEKYLNYPVLTDEYLVPYIVSALRTKSTAKLLNTVGINEDLLGRLLKAPVPCSYAELSD